ncbi:hypothetical protein ACSFCG_12600 [Enterococcus faecalis]
MEKEWMKQEAKTGTIAVSDPELFASAKMTKFAQQQLDKGRDYCFFYCNAFRFEKEGSEDNCLMIFSINEPQTLESAAKRDLVLSEDEQLVVNRYL